MKYGIVTGVDQAHIPAQVGFDFNELPLAPTLQPLEPLSEDLEDFRRSFRNPGPLPEAWCVLLPGELKVAGDQVDAALLKSYIETGFARASSLGGQLVVFGSGASRKTPEGFAYERSWMQIHAFLSMAADAARRHHMMIAIEPLNRSECNILTSVAEAVQMARQLDRPEVGVLSDLYHVDFEQQSYAETAEAGALLQHVHVAIGRERRAPCARDLNHLTRYFVALRAAGYDRRISIESSWSDLDGQAAGALTVLKAAWEGSAAV